MTSYTPLPTHNEEIIPPECHIKIWGFMTLDLDLKKTELLVYALIYGYFRSAKPFLGSIRYISEFIGAGKTATVAALKSLCEKGLIYKFNRHDEYGRQTTGYGIVAAALPRIEMHKNIHSLLDSDKGKAK